MLGIIIGLLTINVGIGTFFIVGLQTVFNVEFESWQEILIFIGVFMSIDANAWLERKRKALR